MVPLAEIRIQFHIFQEIVHPSHVPFMGEAQSVLFRFSGHFRPCCGFLCDHHCSMISAQHNAVQMFEELDRFQIFIAAVNIRGPLTVFSSIIQIKNGCHRIDTQSVDMELLNPVKCIGDQEILDFALAKIKDFCSPFRMLALFGIRILVNSIHRQILPVRVHPRGKCAGTQSRITPIFCLCR